MLPDWLAHPSIIQAGLKHQKLDQSEEIDYSGFEILDKDLREKLSEQGIKSFFPGISNSFENRNWKGNTFIVFCYHLIAKNTENYNLKICTELK